MDKETIFTFVLKINTEKAKLGPNQSQDQNLDGLGENMNQVLIAAAEQALNGQFNSQRIECTYDVIQMAHGTTIPPSEGQINELRTATMDSVQRQYSITNGDTALTIFRETGQNIVLKSQIEAGRQALARNDQQNQEIVNLIEAANGDANNLAAQLDDHWILYYV